MKEWKKFKELIADTIKNATETRIKLLSEPFSEAFNNAAIDLNLIKSLKEFASKNNITLGEADKEAIIRDILRKAMIKCDFAPLKLKQKDKENMIDEIIRQMGISVMFTKGETFSRVLAIESEVRMKKNVDGTYSVDLEKIPKAIKKRGFAQIDILCDEDSEPVQLDKYTFGCKIKKYKRGEGEE
ncbi:MAG: hypothetical protein ACP6IY_18510 [Promethearchaeia archaeon]